MFNRLSINKSYEDVDYDDFFIASKTDAEEQYENAKELFIVIRKYLEKKRGDEKCLF